MVKEKVGMVFAKIAAAAAGSGREPSSVQLMAAVKTRSPDEISAVLAAGVTLLGENRVQEGLSHLEALRERELRTFRVHFIGRLQSNKAGKALSAFDSIDSVENFHLASRLSRIAVDAGRVREVMMEVNLGGEEQKGGVSVDDATSLAERLFGLPGLFLTGLMGIPPHPKDAEASRPHFRRLAGLFKAIGEKHPEPVLFRNLSMGMSNDFEVAVEEGATIVRVGTALFGPRACSLDGGIR